MDTSIYHYTYLIEDTRPTHPTKHLYMGVRSSKVPPEQDRYMGSSTVEEFKEAIKTRRDDFNKYILKLFPTRMEANLSEINYHRRFNVAEHSVYWNESNANSSFSHRKSDPKERVFVCLDLFSGETYSVKQSELTQNHIIAGRFNGVYVTPWGNFSSAQKAASGCPVKISVNCCLRACKDNTRIINLRTTQLNPYLNKSHLGKTFADVGFTFIEYDKKNNEMIAKLLNIEYKMDCAIKARRDQRELMDMFSTTQVKIVTTPFGVGCRSDFVERGFGVLVRCIEQSNYSNNVARYFGVNDWKASGYSVEKYTGQSIVDIDKHKDLIELITLLESRGVRYTTFNGVYVTPDGYYSSKPEVAKKSKYSKNSQKIWDKIDTPITMRMIAQSSLLTVDDVGSTYRDKGFRLEEYIPGVNEKDMIQMLNFLDDK